MSVLATWLAFHVSSVAHPNWQHQSEPERQRMLSSWAPLSLSERLRRISGAYLDTPYVASPLGEGEGLDPDPTFRLDAVDCLTFVEQTMAQSLTCDFGATPSLLEQIRYGGEPSYQDRNHLMEAQWIPHNVDRGFIKDVTALYGGKDAVSVSKVVTRDTWRSSSSRSLNLSKNRQPVGTFPFTMIPLEKAFPHLAKVADGTLLLVVREDLPYKVTRVTHLGFLFRDKGKIMLRHAARNVFRRVVDEDLRHFLARNSRYEKWKVTGFALYQVQDHRPD